MEINKNGNIIFYPVYDVQLYENKTILDNLYISFEYFRYLEDKECF